MMYQSLLSLTLNTIENSKLVFLIISLFTNKKMKILYDLTATQPSWNAKIHGGQLRYYGLFCPLGEKCRSGMCLE